MKPDRFMFVPDVHGSEQDPETISAILSHARDFKPDIRIIGGDLWDFAALRAGASQEDENEDLHEDWVAGEKFARAFLKGGKEHHLMLGNHDCRPWRLLRSPRALVRQFAQSCIEDIEGLAKDLKAKLYPYSNRSILQLGHLKVLHGIGGGGMNMLQVHARAYGNCLVGHGHGFGRFTISNVDGPKEAVMCPCSCRLNMSYCAHTEGNLRHENGWAYGYVFPDGTYELLCTRRIGGDFRVFAEMQSY